jgi:predicted nucleic acid-binding protein
MDRSPVLVDSDVLLDIFTIDPQWYEWSAAALTEVAERSVLVVNPIIYAEISVCFDTIESLEESLPTSSFRRDPLPWESGFLAGKVFVGSPHRRGSKHAPLRDFYIAAHAAVAGFSILTRDRRRYETSFPRVALISPDL